MRIDELKELLPPDADITLVKWQDERGTKFRLSAPKVVASKAYDTSTREKFYKRRDQEELDRCVDMASARNAEYEGQETTRRDTEAAFYKPCDEEDAPYGLNNPGDEYPGGVL